MEHDVVLEKCPDDTFFGYSEEIEDVYVTGSNRDSVLDRLRTQIHYQLEYCPCSFIKPERLDLNITEKEGLCDVPG